MGVSRVYRAAKRRVERGRGRERATYTYTYMTRGLPCRGSISPWAYTCSRVILSNWNNTVSQASRDIIPTELELEKCQYEYMREIEHSSFTPLVFSGSHSFNFYKRLASCIAAKWHQLYSAGTTCMSWILTMLTYLLPSSISNPMHQGARSSIGHAMHKPSP